VVAVISISKTRAKIIETIYNDEDNKGNKSGAFYEKTLADAINMTSQNIVKHLKYLEERKIIELRQEPLKKKRGVGKYIYHTPYGKFLYTVLQPPKIEKIDEFIVAFLEKNLILPSPELVADAIERSLAEPEIKIIIDMRLAAFKNNIQTIEELIEAAVNPEPPKRNKQNKSSNSLGNLTMEELVELKKRYEQERLKNIEEGVFSSVKNRGINIPPKYVKLLIKKHIK
jgi:DNA-binding MarR family transcriptional regulator